MGMKQAPRIYIQDILHSIMHPLTGSIYMLERLTFTQIYVLKLIWGRDCVDPRDSVRDSTEPDHRVLVYLKFHVVFLLLFRSGTKINLSQRSFFCLGTFTNL
jgi:hypothetical protein